MANVSLPILEESVLHSTQDDTKQPTQNILSIIKVSARGIAILKLCLPSTESTPTTATTSVISQTAVSTVTATLTQQVEAKTRPALHHIQRIMPIHTTCSMHSVDVLKAAGGRLAPVVFNIVREQMGDKAAEEGYAASFAVGYKSRSLGVGEKDKKKKEKKSGDADATKDVVNSDTSAPTLDRMAIIQAVASGLETTLKAAPYNVAVKVDLKTPNIIVLIEEVHVVVGNDKNYSTNAACAVLGAVPAELCVLKPKFIMKHIGASNSGDKN